MHRCRLVLSFVTLILPTLVRADAPKAGYPPPQEVKQAFLKLLDRPKVPFDIKMVETKRDADGLVTEHFSIATEKKANGDIERVPVLLVRPEKATGKLPAVIVLHGTGGSKEGQRSWLVDLAKRGMIGVAIDARYHGERAGGAKGSDAYNQAIVRAWKAKAGEPQEHPFYYDTCWDLWRTVDYLQTRDDIDPQRIGMVGISMGGIQTWLAAAVDERVKVAVPAIAVQSFAWSLENDKWQARARTIRLAHDEAAKDLGEPEVNKKVCKELWNKVIPGMLDQFDCPSMIRLFAGRSLLIVSGDEDPNCPIEGAKLAIASAEQAFKDAKASDKLRIMVATGVGHRVTDEQRRAALEWFEKHLLAADAPKPAYPDKKNLMVYLDAAGKEQPVRTAADWQKRREHILANMQLVMGPLPEFRRTVPLDVNVQAEESLDKVTRKKITFAVEKDDRVTAYLLIPKDLKGKAPAVLCLHQTTKIGKGEPAGVGGSKNLHYALELAERGYVTLAPDYPNFGDYQVDAYARGYDSATMKGIWNHMRAVDLLQSLPEVDGERIGCIGHSLGGHNSLFVAAFEPRIKVVVTSCGFNSFSKYSKGDLTGWSHKGYMPRIASVYGKDAKQMPFDFTEILGTLAPRAVFINAPLKDDNFEVSGVRDCVTAATPVYELLGAKDQLWAEYPDAGHDFPPEVREAAYQFVDKALGRQ